LLVYPNPANSNIVIEQYESIKGSTIEIYDVQGQLLLKQPVQQGKIEIDISGLTKGMYFIKIGRDKKMNVKKLVKE